MESDLYFTLALAAFYNLAVLLMALIVLALLLGKSNEIRQLIAALRDLFKRWR